MSEIIGANILNIAKQDYDPQGASVTILIAEGHPPTDHQCTEQAEHETPGPLPETIVGHLDKSHIAVHTYPESHPDDGISTFRADIDVSTCGHISPLNALNYLIHSFESDIITIDYRVRGFTRDVSVKIFYRSQNQFDPKLYSRQHKEKYQAIDVNVYRKYFPYQNDPQRVRSG